MISDGNEPNAVKISFGVGLTSANSKVNGFRRDSADLTCLNFIREYAALVPVSSFQALYASSISNVMSGRELMLI